MGEIIIKDIDAENVYLDLYYAITHALMFTDADKEDCDLCVKNVIDTLKTLSVKEFPK